MSNTGNTGILSEPKPFGKYYLLERISVGGMAEIFKAKAFGVEGFERLLAVKRILDQIAEDEAFIDMFIDEAKIAGKLNHPNIAQIFDLGKEEGSYYIALEYISGKDLKTLLEASRDQGNPLDIPQIVYTVMKVCEGLEHAHTKKDAQGEPLNIVHRDISPQNVLISYEGEVKIIDFGIAKAQGKTSQTQVGVLKGKFSYMSPEQVRGLHVDHRSDIFSLGIVLYELLTLERLFLGDSDFDTLEQIRKVEISPPSLYNPDIPQELEDIVLKALAKNPDDRFQSTADFAEALERFMRSEGYYYKNKDLASFMKNEYREDLEFEQRKLEYYQNLDLKPPQQISKEPEGLGWGEEEMETQIFDRDQPIPEVDGGGGGGQPQESGIVYAEDGPQSQPEGANGGDEVEVVGPDNEVDVITPDDAQQQDGGGAGGNEAPTIEYDRDSVDGPPVSGESAVNEQDGGGDDIFESPGPSSQTSDQQQDAPPAREARRHDSTAKLDEVEAEQRRPRSDSGSLRWQRVLAVALVVVVVAGGAALGIFHEQLFSSSAEAKVEFAPTPANVTILVDGEKVYEGETPRAIPLEPGKVDIKLTSDGYKPFGKSVTLKKGQPYKIDWTLEKAPPTGTLVVKSTPKGAEVLLDGESVGGTTPVTLPEIDRGGHKLTLQKQGFQALSKQIEVPGGEETTIEESLKALKLSVAIKSDPASANYRVIEPSSGKEVKSGETPATVEGLDGGQSYRVELTRDGYEDWETTLESGTKEKRTVQAELERDQTTVAATGQTDDSTGSQSDPSAQPEADPTGSPGSRSPQSSGGVQDLADESTGAPESGGGGEPAGSEESQPSDSADQNQPAAAGSETTQQDPNQQKAAKGRLSIQSRPVAKVYIDGKDIGQRTPVINYEVSAGKHRIKLVNKEFGLSRTMYVTVEPGEAKKVINTPDK
jgi:serine/threonine protein kinase